MSFDFRASQVRTNKLITSGSTGTPAKLLIYDISADGTPANQGNIDNNVFASGSVGADTFIYVSGSKSSITGSNGGTVVFGGDVRVSGTFQAITETDVDDFYQPPHVIVNRNSGGIDSLDNGGVFIASVGNLALSFGGKATTSGLEFSIRSSQGGIEYTPSASQIVLRNESNGGIFLNSYGQWGGGGISIGQGLIDDHQAHDGQLLLYADSAYVSMSAHTDMHLKAGNDESSTIKFYTFLNPVPVSFSDANNTSITSSLANRTIVGAINELKVSASLGGSSFPTRLTVGNYNTVTQSNSQTVGGNYFVSTEHNSTTKVLRTILSTSDAANTAHIRLFSITDGYYLPIGGAGVFELNTVSTTPTVLTSSNLTMLTSSLLLEVQVSGTIGGGSLAIVHHNSEIVFT